MTDSSPRAEFAAGMRAYVPLTMATVPFGMICGAVAIASGMTPWQAGTAGLIIFAGSAQIVMMQLLASGAPSLVIIATVAIMNLRFMIYATSLGPHFAKLSRSWRVLLAYLITDQGYVLGVLRYMEPGDTRHRHWYYFGMSAGLWLCWQLSSLAGVLVGSLIPPEWSADFIVPLTFISIVVPLFSNPAMLLAGLAGGAASVLLVLPLKLNMIAAALIGVAAGLSAEKLGFGTTRTEGTERNN
jgi:predicted branched-subunit amino acid permease